MSLLIENSRTNPGAGFYFEMRKFYFALSDEDIRKNPDLMSGMSMLYSLLMNHEESERWYQELKEYSKVCSGSMKQYSKSLLLYLDISLPHRGIEDMVNILKHAGILIRNRKTVLPEFSVTSNLPSMMNGGKDFCEWSKRDTELADSIEKVVSFVLGKYGKGLVNLALAESFFEKGVDRYEVASLLANGRMQADSGGKLEQVFVADGLMAWLSVFDGKLMMAKDRLDSLYKKLESEHGEKMLANVTTLLIRLDMYNGNIGAALKWLETAPDENVEFIIYDRFHYLAKVRIYLCIGKNDLAVELIHKLLYYAEIMKRIYIRMECNLLLAIAQYRMGHDDWDKTLALCLSEAQEYNFVRIIAREGAAVERLLQKTTWKAENQEYWNQVIEETKKISKLYPAYMKENIEDVVLCDNALAILKLQAEGLSVSQIAKRLHIQEGTVKYHNTQTYQKLGVRDKVGAVTEAYRRGIL